MARLVIQNGKGHPHQHPVGAPVITIGRASENTIVIAHDSVSGRHAEIVRDDRGYSVRDLQSSHGTTVNGEPVVDQPIGDGDLITFGAVETQFVQDEVHIESGERPAGEVSVVDQPLPKNGSGAAVEHEVQHLKSISSSSRHTAAKVIQHICRAARLTALKAKIEKLKLIDLNKAHYALGKRAFELGLFREQLDSERQAIAELERRIKTKRAGLTAAEQETAGEKIRRIAGDAKMAAEAEGLSVKLKRLLTVFGRQIASLSTYPVDLDAEISVVVALNALIHRDETQFRNALRTLPKVSLLVCVIIIAMIGLSVLHKAGHREDRSEASSPQIASGTQSPHPVADGMQETSSFREILRLYPADDRGVSPNRGISYRHTWHSGDIDLMVDEAEGQLASVYYYYHSEPSASVIGKHLQQHAGVSSWDELGPNGDAPGDNLDAAKQRWKRKDGQLLASFEIGRNKTKAFAVWIRTPKVGMDHDEHFHWAMRVMGGTYAIDPQLFGDGSDPKRLATLPIAQFGQVKDYLSGFEWTKDRDSTNVCIPKGSSYYGYSPRDKIKCYIVTIEEAVHFFRIDFPGEISVDEADVWRKRFSNSLNWESYQPPLRIYGQCWIREDREAVAQRDLGQNGSTVEVYSGVYGKWLNDQLQGR